MSFSFRVSRAWPTVPYLTSPTILGGAPLDQGGKWSREKPGSLLETTQEASGGKRIGIDTQDLSVSSPDHRFICPFGLSSSLP